MRSTCDVLRTMNLLLVVSALALVGGACDDDPVGSPPDASVDADNADQGSKDSSTDTAAVTDLGPDAPVVDAPMDIPGDVGVDAPVGDGYCAGDATQTCYTGAAGTMGVGVCKAGSQICSGGTWGACTGQVLPTTEICDNTDNNCDGKTDEALTQTCYNGAQGTAGVGLCTSGIQVCTAGSWSVCAGEVLPATEVCDNKDNNCDGKIDESLIQTCYTGASGTKGVGLCKAGNQTCSAGSWSTCAGEVLPATEVCDNKDNNCDGKTDETLTQSCYTGKAGTKGVGLCKAGSQTCSAGSWSTCAGEVLPATEVCDNKDNNCDGKTDETLTRSCYTGASGTKGVGLCKAGTQACAAGKWSSCSGQVLPKTEVCDNKDNDCDSKTDETLTQSCYTGATGTKGVGLCKAGTQACAAGKWSSCSGQVLPKTETCDSGKDNDCDGKTDEGCGCSDGSREGFTDAAKYPGIAGCSGGWSVKGILTAKSPKCGLKSGNSSANGTGKGCAAEDLCAAGWHICKSPAEVKSRSSTGCSGVASSGSLFFSTRQSGPGSGSCGSGANDIFGCGTYGAAPSGNCSPLNRFGHNLCSALGSPWSCGSNGYQEANNVIKSSSAKGGVLCCK